jgi:hypothetical protein
MTRPELGQDVPCPRCHMTGEVAAPALTRGEQMSRARENARRRQARLAPLDPPPRWVTCPRCGGDGLIPAAQEVTEIHPGDLPPDRLL